VSRNERRRPGFGQRKLAIGYAAVLLLLGELYITSRSTEIAAISIKRSASMPQAFHPISAADN
jgi:hypothetical protein